VNRTNSNPEVLSREIFAHSLLNGIYYLVLKLRISLPSFQRSSRVNLLCVQDADSFEIASKDLCVINCK
jgi:hypothetical protein